jgi:hypothetical protein
MILPQANTEITASPTRDEALRLAHEGVPVLPTKPDKSPYTRHGVHDATTDAGLIGEWWEKHPDAGVAMRTGRISGIIELDLDSKAALEEALRRGLPDETDAVRTRRGWRWRFRAPDEPLPSRDLFSGAELKAEGLYVVVPPSLHPSGFRYRLWPSTTGKLAPVPAWIVEVLAERNHSESSDADSFVALNLDGPPIFEGMRNRSLFRCGCSARAHGANRASILSNLAALNAALCTPPLDHREVEKIAQSVCRYPPGTAASPAAQEVHDFLAEFEAAISAHPWRGSGLTDQDVLLALVEFARQFGTMIPTGARVEAAFRDLALVAGASLRTLHRSVKRVKPSGWLTQDNATRKPDEAGAFVLRIPRRYWHHSTTLGTPPSGTGGASICVPNLRWGGLGKKKGALLRALSSMGGAATVSEIACFLRDSRPWDLRRLQVLPLAEAGIVEFDAATDVVALARRWEQALADERALRGEIMAEQRDRVLYETQRRDFRAGRRR